MKSKLLKKVKPGELITAAMWNDLIDFMCRCEVLVGAGSGLLAQSGPDGVALAVAARGDRLLAVADGVITARSGATAGTGNVFLVTVSGGALTTTTISYPVYNPSSTTMTSGSGIDSGQYCLIEEVPSGLFMVTPLECA